MVHIFNALIIHNRVSSSNSYLISQELFRISQRHESHSRCLEDFKVIEAPKRIIKRIGILRCVLLATISRTSPFRRVDALGASKRPANVDVSHDTQISEVTTDITISAREIRNRLAPVRGVRTSASSDISWDRVPVKEPHPNPGVPQFHSVDTTAATVERFTKGLDRALHATAGIRVRAIETRTLQRRATHLALHTLHCAAPRRMQRHLIPLDPLIHRLDHIDLAVVRPRILVCEPDGRPACAAIGRVRDIEDEEARIVGCACGDAGGVPACGGIFFCVVDAEVGLFCHVVVAC